MSDISFDLQIILAAGLAGSLTAPLGTLLVLRRQAMLSDAIAHSVLPGIVAGYLLTGTRNVWTMAAGALGAALAATLGIETLERRVGLQSEASIGVVFTLFFALGVIGLAKLAGSIDLDQDCVLYGELAYVPLDVWVTSSGTVLGPRAWYRLGMTLILVWGLLAAFWRPLLLASFDQAQAHNAGLPVRWLHFLVVFLTALACVAAFEAVGAILIIALLVGPAATALLLTDRLGHVLVYALVISWISVLGGYILAWVVNGSVAGAIATMAGVYFVLALLISHVMTLRARKRIEPLPVGS